MFTECVEGLLTEQAVKSSSGHPVAVVHTYFHIPLTAESGVLYVYFYCMVSFSSYASQAFCANGNWLSFLLDFSPNGLPLVCYPKKSLSLDQTLFIQTYQYLSDINTDGEQ